MIPDAAKNAFQAIITDEMFEMNKNLADSFNATAAKMAARGLGSSGASMKGLAQNAVDSLKARGQVILSQLLRCLAAYQVQLTPAAVAEASRILKDAVETESQVIYSKLFAHGAFKNPPPSAKQRIEGDYSQEAPRLIRRLVTELELAAAAASRADESSNGAAAPTQNFTFNAPVGVVQTGPQSVATIQQHLAEAGVREEIAAALSAMLGDLKSPAGETIANRLELQEIIVDAKTEIEKSNPNVLKLRSGLQAIAETTKFVGSLGPAYRVLKPLLSYFGISL